MTAARGPCACGLHRVNRGQRFENAGSNGWHTVEACGDDVAGVTCRVPDRKPTEAAPYRVEQPQAEWWDVVGPDTRVEAFTDPETAEAWASRLNAAHAAGRAEAAEEAGREWAQDEVAWHAEVDRLEARCKALEAALGDCVALIESKYPRACADSTARMAVGDPQVGDVAPVYRAARAALAAAKGGAA